MSVPLPTLCLVAILLLVDGRFAQAQVPAFRDHIGSLLSEAGISSPPFSTATPIGVVDLNGDGKDDIVRVHDRVQLSIELQTSPGAPFTHDFVGDIYEDLCAAICVADIDADGLSDILIGGYGTGFSFGQGSLEIYRPNASATAWSADPDPFRDGALFTQGTIFTDLNNDGAVDIVVCDDIDDPEKFMNDGNGNFSAAAPNVFPTALTPDASDPFPNQGNYAIIATDYDNDGDTDYYLSKCRLNDGVTTSLRRINRLFRNEGSNTYVEVSGAAGLDDGDQSWHADFGDVDNDGDLDCFVLNHQFDAAHANGPSGPSALFINDGSGNFTESAAAGIDVDFLGNQALFHDFNNDGFVDLLVSAMDSSDYDYYQNDGDGTFTAYGPPDGIFKKANGIDPVARLHSFAVGDLNHDGHLDVYAGRGWGIIQSTNEKDLLCLNLGNSNRFLNVRLVGSTSNPNGIGARLEAHGPWGAGGGPGIQVREVRSGEGYGMMNSLNAHFGLGAATAVNELCVKWPSGTVDTIPDVPGTHVTVFEGTGAAATWYSDWISAFYPGGGPDAAPTADPENDGAPNALEHVCGWNPTVVDAGAAAQASVIEDGGQQYFLIEVDRAATMGSILDVEFSDDAIHWSEDAALEIVEDTLLRFVARLPVAIPATPRLFARLTVQVAQ